MKVAAVRFRRGTDERLPGEGQLVFAVGGVQLPLQVRRDARRRGGGQQAEEGPQHAGAADEVPEPVAPIRRVDEVAVLEGQALFGSPPPSPSPMRSKSPAWRSRKYSRLPIHSPTQRPAARRAFTQARNRAWAAVSMPGRPTHTSKQSPRKSQSASGCAAVAASRPTSSELQWGSATRMSSCEGSGRFSSPRRHECAIHRPRARRRRGWPPPGPARRRACPPSSRRHPRPGPG